MHAHEALRQANIQIQQIYGKNLDYHNHLFIYGSFI